MGNVITKSEKRKKKKRKFIRGDASIKIINTPEFFAPSKEDCIVTYKLKRSENSTDRNVKLTIKDKDSNEVYSNDTLGLADDGDRDFKWNGKDSSGNYISPLQSPFTVSISMSKNPMIKDERKVKVEIEDLIWKEIPENKLYMNDPERKIEMETTVRIKNSKGAGVVTAIPMEVTFTYADPAPENTKQSDSYKYQTAPEKYLGKKDAPNAIYWEAHPDCPTSSPDGYKTKCKVGVMTADGANQGKAKVYFRPSGVGGDNFKLESTVFATDNSTKLTKKESNKFTIWRTIHYEKIYTMNGENYVDAATTHAQIGPAFETDAFVAYSRGGVKTLNANLTVKYIGLYKT